MQAQGLDSEDGFIREAIRGERDRFWELTPHVWQASDTRSARAAQLAACLIAAASVAAHHYTRRHPARKPDDGALIALAGLAPRVVGELPEHVRGIWIAAYLERQPFETYSALKGAERAYREYRELVRTLARVMPMLAHSGSP